MEPSLQAAFVEYGGNRHGFLAFNEIHPDYFQIPQADREALLREAAEPHDDDAPTGESAEGEAADDDEAIERELDRRRQRMLRKYKIQEVLRRRQIMLVQVVKEERGNKGAALTTYLSLAGRYCVLMPNTARGGGISRKITNAADRKRLKSATSSLDVPHGMGLIVRTAGASRTKAEIKRDYDYLLRMWENIRETTLQSIAPSLIYAEEDLVKRAVRDMFDKEFDSIQVEGEAGYREAREFMRLIMPSQANKVVHYKDATPLFVRHRVEDQIGLIHSPVVPLRSGGYLVINQTEALVAIDVNSGRATRERNIEQTALKTNMEAAEEATRQLRLRDLAGLIVIDFIDMDEGKNNRAVEKVLKDGLKEDRARVQMGRISAFGLMEISRQRRRMGVLEGSTHVCPTCNGAGRVRSPESAALQALRALELEAVTGGAGAAVLRLPQAVGLYVLNCKRAYLLRLEETHGLAVTVMLDDALGADEQAIERTESREGGQPLQLEPPPVALSGPDELDVDADDDEPADEAPGAEDVEVEVVGDEAQEDGELREGRREERGRRGRRRRGGRGRDEAEAPLEAASDAGSREGEAAVEADADGEAPRPGETEGEAQGRRRRRGRRGGRRAREEGGETPAADPYGWRRSERVPEGADVYAWRDPLGAAPDAEAAEPFAAPEPQGADPVAVAVARSPTERETAEPAAGPQTAAVEGADPYAWAEPGAETPALAPEVEAPAAKPRRVRAPRRRKGEAVAEPVATDVGAPLELAGAVLSQPGPAPEAQAPVEAVIQAEPSPAPQVQVAPDAQASRPAEHDPADAPPEPEPEPEPAAAAPEPLAAIAPPEPDPAEISAPAAAPRRGWWRRGK